MRKVYRNGKFTNEQVSISERSTATCGERIVRIGFPDEEVPLVWMFTKALLRNNCNSPNKRPKKIHQALRTKDCSIGYSVVKACVIDGMTAINSKMLHRDLKPDNILLDGDIPKIADFGLSKLVGAATRTSTFKGGQHVLYMAPEGWKGDKNEIQFDMYALGIIFYEIAALKYPYSVPADPNGLRDIRLFQAALPLRLQRPDLPTAFCHIVTKLMEKSPLSRFVQWSEVKDAVLRAFATVSVATAKSSSIIDSMLNTVGALHDIHSKRKL